MFEKATRLKLRFQLNGSCSAEDLWDFKKETLADYEAKLQELVEKAGKRNRFSKANQETSLNELRLKIVSYIIDTKVSEEEDSAVKLANKIQAQKLLEEKARRQESKISEISDDELDAKIKALTETE